MTVGRFQRRDATEQSTGVLQRGDAVEQPVAHLVRSARVDLRSARLLAEPDDGHLRQAALDRALEARVRLDPVDRHDPIGAGRVAVEVQRHAVGCSGNLDRLHGRPDLAVDGLFGHPERLQHRPLTLGRRAAVAAHRRHDERLCAEVAQPTDRTPQQADSFDETTTAGADGDGHARGDGTRQPLDDLAMGRAFDVVDRDRVWGSGA